MSTIFRELQIALPTQIISDLGIPTSVLVVDGPDTFLRLLVEPDRYGGTYNHYQQSSVINGFNRAVIRPVSPQRRISIECRESRLFVYLAIKKLAEQSAIAASLGETRQLVKIRDELLPSYSSYSAQVNSSAPVRTYTERLGIIDASSIQMSGTLNVCGILDVSLATRIRFDFIQSTVEVL